MSAYVITMSVCVCGEERVLNECCKGIMRRLTMCVYVKGRRGG